MSFYTKDTAPAVDPEVEHALDHSLPHDSHGLSVGHTQEQHELSPIPESNAEVPQVPERKSMTKSKSKSRRQKQKSVKSRVSASFTIGSRVIWLLDVSCTGDRVTRVDAVQYAPLRGRVRSWIVPAGPSGAGAWMSLLTAVSNSAPLAAEVPCIVTHAMWSVEPRVRSALAAAHVSVPDWEWVCAVSRVLRRVWPARDTSLDAAVSALGMPPFDPDRPRTAVEALAVVLDAAAEQLAYIHAVDLHVGDEFGEERQKLSEEEILGERNLRALLFALGRPHRGGEAGASFRAWWCVFLRIFSSVWVGMPCAEKETSISCAVVQLAPPAPVTASEANTSNGTTESAPVPLTASEANTSGGTTESAPTTVVSVPAAPDSGTIPASKSTDAYAPPSVLQENVSVSVIHMGTPSSSKKDLASGRCSERGGSSSTTHVEGPEPHSSVPDTVSLSGEETNPEIRESLKFAQGLSLADGNIPKYQSFADHSSMQFEKGGFEHGSRSSQRHSRASSVDRHERSSLRSPVPHASHATLKGAPDVPDIYHHDTVETAFSEGSTCEGGSQPSVDDPISPVIPNETHSVGDTDGLSHGFRFEHDGTLDKTNLMSPNWPVSSSKPEDGYSIEENYEACDSSDGDIDSKLLTATSEHEAIKERVFAVDEGNEFFKKPAVVRDSMHVVAPCEHDDVQLSKTNVDVSFGKRQIASPLAGYESGMLSEGIADMSAASIPPRPREMSRSEILRVSDVAMADFRYIDNRVSRKHANVSSTSSSLAHVVEVSSKTFSGDCNQSSNTLCSSPPASIRAHNSPTISLISRAGRSTDRHSSAYSTSDARSVMQKSPETDGKLSMPAMATSPMASESKSNMSGYTHREVVETRSDSESNSATPGMVSKRILFFGAGVSQDHCATPWTPVGDNESEVSTSFLRHAPQSSDLTPGSTNPRSPGPSLEKLHSGNDLRGEETRSCVSGQSPAGSILKANAVLNRSEGLGPASKRLGTESCPPREPSFVALPLVDATISEVRSEKSSPRVQSSRGKAGGDFVCIPDGEESVSADEVTESRDTERIAGGTPNVLGPALDEVERLNAFADDGLTVYEAAFKLESENPKAPPDSSFVETIHGAVQSSLPQLAPMALEISPTLKAIRMQGISSGAMSKRVDKHSSVLSSAPRNGGLPIGIGARTGVCPVVATDVQESYFIDGIPLHMFGVTQEDSLEGLFDPSKVPVYRKDGSSRVAVERTSSERTSGGLQADCMSAETTMGLLSRSERSLEPQVLQASARIKKSSMFGFQATNQDPSRIETEIVTGVPSFTGISPRPDELDTGGRYQTSSDSGARCLPETFNASDVSPKLTVQKGDLFAFGTSGLGIAAISTVVRSTSEEKSSEAGVDFRGPLRDGPSKNGGLPTNATESSSQSVLIDPAEVNLPVKFGSPEGLEPKSRGLSMGDGDISYVRNLTAHTRVSAQKRLIADDTSRSELYTRSEWKTSLAMSPVRVSRKYVREPRHHPSPPTTRSVQVSWKRESMRQEDAPAFAVLQAAVASNSPRDGGKGAPPVSIAHRDSIDS